MQESLLTRQGEVWESNKGPVQAIVLAYYKQNLQNRLSGGIGREAMTLAFALDLLLRGNVASASDALMQRLKSLELVSNQIPWSIAQRVELVPRETAAIASQVEASEAARVSLTEAKAFYPRGSDNTLGRAPRSDMPVKGAYNIKGKGKGKKGKEKEGAKDAAKEKKKE